MVCWTVVFAGKKILCPTYSPKIDVCLRWNPCCCRVVLQQKSPALFNPTSGSPPDLRSELSKASWSFPPPDGWGGWRMTNLTKTRYGWFREWGTPQWMVSNGKSC
jgi:hypothetical protein